MDNFKLKCGNLVSNEIDMGGVSSFSGKEIHMPFFLAMSIPLLYIICVEIKGLIIFVMLKLLTLLFAWVLVYNKKSNSQNLFWDTGFVDLATIELVILRNIQNLTESLAKISSCCCVLYIPGPPCLPPEVSDPCYGRCERFLVSIVSLVSLALLCVSSLT